MKVRAILASSTLLVTTAVLVTPSNAGGCRSHNRIDEGGLPSAAVRSTADHGVAMRPQYQ